MDGETSSARGFGDGKSLVMAEDELVPLDCNGKPLGYVPNPQLGRCWFGDSPHPKGDWCFRWYVLRYDETERDPDGVACIYCGALVDYHETDERGRCARCETALATGGSPGCAGGCE